MVRGFAGYLRTIDPATEVPPTGLLIHRKRYAIPYLYSDAEIGRLLAGAAALPPPLRAATYHTLIGLLAVAGMRIGEALRLDRDDVDLARRSADDPPHQVRKVPAAAAARLDVRGACRL